MTLIPDDSGPQFGVLDTSGVTNPNFFDIPEEVSEEDKQSNRFADLERKNAELEARINQRSNFEQTYQPPQNNNFVPSHNQAPQVDQAAFKKQLSEEFFRDPGETLTKVLLAAQQNADQAAARKFVPVAAMAVRNQIGMFKAAAGMDEDVAKEFDNLVNSIPDETLATADPKSLQTHLVNLKRMAIGTASENGWSPKSNRTVPNYGGSGTPAAKPGHKRVTLTQEQKEAMDMLQGDPFYRKLYDTPEKMYNAVKDI
jgi:hypothetical protein